MAGVITKVRAALDRGGVKELVLTSRRWLAGVIEPAPPPAPPRARPKPVAKPAPVAPPPSSADSVDHAAAMAWFAPRRPTYENFAAVVAPYVDRDGLVLDVGANIGYFTAVVGEALDFRGTVHLFEPVPNLATLCEQTLADVPFETVVHRYGLSDEAATLDIFIAADGNLGWNTMVADKASAGMVPVQIEVRPFDEVGIEGTPCFVKIDVEGAEYRVLRGLLPALARWEPRPAILCEIGWGSGHPAWQEELAVFRELEALGYRALDLAKEPIDLEGLTKTTDVLFVPAGR